MPMTRLWLAEMESEHYSWRGAGRTKDEALAALAAAWEAHAEQLRGDGFADIMRASAALEYYGAHCVLIELGGYRDDVRIADASATVSTPTKED